MSPRTPATDYPDGLLPACEHAADRQSDLCALPLVVRVHEGVVAVTCRACFARLVGREPTDTDHVRQAASLSGATRAARD